MISRLTGQQGSGLESANKSHWYKTWKLEEEH